MSEALLDFFKAVLQKYTVKDGGDKNSTQAPSSCLCKLNTEGCLRVLCANISWKQTFLSNRSLNCFSKLKSNGGVQMGSSSGSWYMLRYGSCRASFTVSRSFGSRLRKRRNSRMALGVAPGNSSAKSAAVFFGNSADTTSAINWFNNNNNRMRYINSTIAQTRPKKWRCTWVQTQWESVRDSSNVLRFLKILWNILFMLSLVGLLRNLKAY